MKISLFILIFLAFYSCSKQKSTANLFPSEIKEYYGKQLILPQQIWYFKGELEVLLSETNNALRRKR